MQWRVELFFLQAVALRRITGVLLPAPRGSGSVGEGVAAGRARAGPGGGCREGRGSPSTGLLTCPTAVTGHGSADS